MKIWRSSSTHKYFTASSNVVFIHPNALMIPPSKNTSSKKVRVFTQLQTQSGPTNLQNRPHKNRPKAIQIRMYPITPVSADLSATLTFFHPKIHLTYAVPENPSHMRSEPIGTDPLMFRTPENHLTCAATCKNSLYPKNPSHIRNGPRSFDIRACTCTAHVRSVKVDI
jgi:hypothetical protein